MKMDMILGAAGWAENPEAAEAVGWIVFHGLLFLALTVGMMVLIVLGTSVLLIKKLRQHRGRFRLRTLLLVLFVISFPLAGLSYLMKSVADSRVTDRSDWREDFEVDTVGFFPEGQRVAYAGPGGVKLCDVSGVDLGSLALGQWVHTMSISPDGTSIATGNQDGSIQLWDVASEKMTREFARHDSCVWSIAFSPDGSTLASAGGDGTVRLWNTVTGDRITELRQHSQDALCVVFSPNGAMLASGSNDQAIALWDAATGALRAKWPAHNAAVSALAFSPDSSLLASGGNDGMVRLWSIETETEAATLSASADIVEAVAFCPDGTTLASTGVHFNRDAIVELWDVETFELKATYADNVDDIGTIAFSPNGAIIVSAGWDATARYWDTRSGKIANEIVLQMTTR